jgi:signal transduction histidine kinase
VRVHSKVSKDSKVTALALVLVVLAPLVLVAGCGENAGVPSVSSLSRQWLEIKKELLTGEFKAPDIEARLEDFNAALDRFFASPAGSLYRIHRPGIAAPVTAIGKTTDRLKEAAGDKTTVPALILEIDAAFDQLQNIDAGLANTIQLRYFQLFFFFSILVIMIVLALSFLNRRLEKAVHRERQSLIFSRETVLAQERERSRLARELHDTVAQDLWRLNFQTDGIHRAADPEDRRLLCEEVIRGQRELMKRLRSICDGLVPPDFRRRLLPDALRSLGHDFARRTGIECTVTVQEGLRLDPLDADQQLQCFRIVQEGLTNIEKHAHAREAAVLVSGLEDQVLRICVSDDGRGFAAPDGDARLAFRAEGRLGLWSMHERAASLRGRLVLDSEAGGGTRLTLEIPLVHEGKP